MDLRQIGYVVAVVDHGSFTRAAASIPVSQPALSQAIAALERELGIALFDRAGRVVRLTDAGEAFLGPARAMLREAGNARTAVADVAAVVTGRLELVSLPTLVAEPLVGLVGAFRQQHPGVTIRITEPDDTASVLDTVRRGASELGLGDGPLEDDAGIVVDHLLDQELLAVLPPGTTRPRRRLDVAAVAAMPLVATPLGTSTRRLIDDAVRAAGAEPTIAVETDHREAIVPLVLAGAGVALLPEPLARRAAEDGATTARLDPPVRRPVVLLRRPGPLAPAAAAFRNLALGVWRRDRR